MSQDLSKLITWPEAQGASRVLAAVTQLEQHLANLQAQKRTASSTPLSTQSEITQLRQENQRLSQRQSRALGKLDTLMAALQSLPDEKPEETEEPAEQPSFTRAA
jgi:chromosome segregation ATPase